DHDADVGRGLLQAVDEGRLSRIGIGPYREGNGARIGRLAVRPLDDGTTTLAAGSSDVDRAASAAPGRAPAPGRRRPQRVALNRGRIASAGGEKGETREPAKPRSLDHDS